MDKQTFNSIKVKINGKDRSKSKGESIDEDITISNWEEKLEAKQEIASAKQPIEDEKEEEFPWLLPDEEESIFQDDPKVVTSSKKRKTLSNQTVTPFQYSTKKKKQSSDLPLKRVLVIPLFAISLGVLFGIIALNFLSNKDMPTAETVSGVVADDDSGKETSGEGNGDTEENEKSKNTAQASSNTTLSLFAVQGGIYSTKENAETVSNTLKDKGLAAIIFEIDGKFTVIAGMGKDKSETTELADQYQQQNLADIEFWGGKNLALPIATTSNADKWASSIQQLASYSALTVNQSTVSEDEIIQAEAAIKAIKTSGDNEKKAAELLLKATVSIKNSQGWEAQQSLLEAVDRLKSE